MSKDIYKVGLTSAQIRDQALERFNKLARKKYDAGQKEHGGLLTDRFLVDELEKEIIDAWFYVQAMRLKIEKTLPFTDV